MTPIPSIRSSKLRATTRALRRSTQIQSLPPPTPMFPTLSRPRPGAGDSGTRGGRRPSRTIPRIAHRIPRRSPHPRCPWRPMTVSFLPQRSAESPGTGAMERPWPPATLSGHKASATRSTSPEPHARIARAGSVRRRAQRPHARRRRSRAQPPLHSGLARPRQVALGRAIAHTWCWPVSPSGRSPATTWAATLRAPESQGGQGLWQLNRGGIGTGDPNLLMAGTRLTLR